jgi:hypothetical protein
MILKPENKTLAAKVTSVDGPTMGLRLKTVIFTRKDFSDLYHKRPEDLHNWVGQMLTRFPPP